MHRTLLGLEIRNQAEYLKNRWTRLAWRQCWNIGFGRFLSLFPRLRDSHATILLNLRIPEPANIEFYGKCLSGEDFCNFCHSSTPCAAPSEGPWKRKSSHMRTGISQGQLWRTYYVYSGGFKRIWMLCIEGEYLRWCGAVMAWSTGPFGSHTNATLEIWAYLKWNYPYVMKIKLYPQVLRSFMLFSFWLTSLGNGTAAVGVL